MAGNVNLIDPHDANINNEIINGIPQYQDMYISAELTAVRRGRTVLTTNIDGSFTKFHEKSGFSSDVKVSFLGEDQKQNQFTTNWYEGSVGSDMTQYEGFGIGSINILVNSSYIPQIDIEFIDIRGLAFFNRENSPYRILFDFPPPIFYLSFKGYYGKAITYQMHLVKYTTEFKHDTGNYNINCKFIAISYAPLTDVLFRHIVQVALFGKNVSYETLSPDVSKPPVNTLDLTLKLKNLYSGVGDAIKSDIDNIKYENAQKRLNNYTQAEEILAGYYNNPILKKQGKPILFTYDQTDGDTNINIIQDLHEYDGIIKDYASLDTPSYVPIHIYVGYISEVKTGTVAAITIGGVSTNPVQNQLFKNLTEYKNTYLITQSNANLGPETIKESDFNVITTISDNKSTSAIEALNSVEYVALDVTNYYFKIYKKKGELETEKNTAMTNLNETINNMIQSELGMRPTIYNIFKILLDDVDTYFQKLRDVSIRSEEHHEKYISDIVTDDSSFKDKKYDDKNKQIIFPFPLIVEDQIKNCIKSEVRRAPTKLSQKLDDPFPELVFIQEFIDSFILANKYIKLSTLLAQQDAQGDNRWIPFTPLDSKLVTNNQRSPYWGTDTPAGGTDDLPIDTTSLDKLSRVFEIILTRFYVFSQNTIPYTFYNRPEREDAFKKPIYYVTSEISKNYMELYAKSEAINLVNSMFNSFYLDMLELASNLYKKDQNEFYKYLNANLRSLYVGTPLSYSLSDTTPIYVTKNDNVDGEPIEYKGVEIKQIGDDIKIRSGGGENKFLDGFFDQFVISGWAKFWTGKNNKQTAQDFTSENLVFLSDNGRNRKKTNDPNRSKFLATLYGLGLGFVSINPEGKENLANTLLSTGNQYFFDTNKGGTHKGGDDDKSQEDTSFIDIWATILDEYGNSDTEFYNEIIDSGNKLTQLMYLSNFGTATSVFNYYPYYLNQDYFTTPSIIEVPRFLAAYTGLLLTLTENEINEIKEFFFTGGGKEINNTGILIFADIYDVNKYLSQKDKDVFLQAYDNFLVDEYNGFNELVELVKNLTITVEEEYEKCLIEAEKKGALTRQNAVSKCGTNRKKSYRENLENEYKRIPEILMKRETIIPYNEITFRFAMDNGDEELEGRYNSLLFLNADTKLKERHDFYFKTLFTELAKNIRERKGDLVKEEEDFKRSAGDEDITTQLYYSFKNINDKWLAGLSKKTYGYPFNNKPENGLIGQFAFVDRAMNPIGDTIISPEILTTALDDPHASIFTVISQLLSLNGFEFFPLQSFLKFQDNEWEDSFKIDNGPLSEQYPVFVCMYIGGAASYPSGIQHFTDFEEDGIIDIANPGVSDFSGGECDNSFGNPDDQQLVTKNHNVYSEVRAFKVRFGEQNQSMFTDISIDSKEYPETDESIQILAQLAGDNKEQAPIPKAQNLYNLYENRSYQATIGALGNAMIQPTQYFQLENVPLYNGAYIILSVEHKLVPNTMTTSFTGTKLLKYPMPRVLEPSSIVGFEGGATTNTNVNASASGDVTEGRNTGSNPEAAQHNSMYDLKIQ